ncbi:phage head morphogenesis protein [Paraburkholderia adhaesiva]|uniref:phage head morphogenesis protein n=1 Tax=Paraburkholderia adhaesiva TaxID=2883244 RepID=UPI001F476664|nr:phage minor head protein [Paraburkholderia adhaesiva]
MGRAIVAPTAKPVTLAAVRPNVGIEAAYRRRLERLIDLMHASLVYWLRACYRANEPELAGDGMGAMARDASPARLLRRTMAKLARRWQRRFDEIAPTLAQRFADSALGHTDGAFAASLKREGFAVDFHLTREANDALQATIGENVGLIRSVAQTHLADVQGIVMRSVQTGQDVGGLTKELQERYALTRRRAAFIARDQNSKATAMVVRVRQAGLGITEAIWLHSHGGRHPRPSHVAADGQRYTISEGMYLDGVWTWPGREPNCRCVSRSVIPGLEAGR